MVKTMKKKTIKKISKNIFIAIGLFLVLAISAIPATAEDFKVPSFKEGWKALPSEATALALKVLMVIVALVVVVIIASVIIGGGEFAAGRATSNTGQSSGGMSRIFKAVGAVVLIFMGIALILWFVG